MRAYSLVETIMVMVVIGIVAAVGVPMMLETADSWSLSSQLQNNAVLTGIVAQSRMSREIRALGNDSAVFNATAAQFNFTDIYNNIIFYNLTGTTLMRNSDGLADNVTALNFTYFDDNNFTIAAPIVGPGNLTNIRRINVSFKIRAGSNNMNFGFQVRPQNLRRLNEKFK